MSKNNRFTAWALVAVIGISLLLKIALALSAADMTLEPDEAQYLFGARSIARTGVPAYPNRYWDEAHASPIYPYLMGGCFLLLPDVKALTAIRIIQAVLSTLTVFLLFRISRRAFNRRVALLSAAIAAFYPALVAFSHYLYAETIYLFLLVLLVDIILSGEQKPGVRRAFAAGLIAGIAALTRSVFLSQLPIILLWFFLARRSGRRWGVRTAAVFLAGMIVTIAPWTVRNTIHYDGFLMIDSNAGNVLYKNLNAIRQENHDIGMGTRWREDAASYVGDIPFRPRVDEKGIAARNSAEVKAAVGFLFRHPLLYAKNCAGRAAELVNPTSFLVKAIKRNHYPGLSPGWGTMLTWITLAGAMIVLTAGAIGIFGTPLTADRTFLLLVILGNTALGVLVVSMSRYRLPMMPFLIPFAVNAVLTWRTLFVGQGKLFRLLPLAAILLFLVWSWIRYIPFSL